MVPEKALSQQGLARAPRLRRARTAPARSSSELQHSRPSTAAPDATLDRRRLLSSTLALAALAGSAGPAALPAAAAEQLADRLNTQGDLRQPGYMLPWESKLLFYPRWMFGEWEVTSKFIGVRAPLGKRFVPGGFQDAGDAPADDGGPGSTYAYSLRYYSTLPDTFRNNMLVALGAGMPEDSIIADRAFNTRSMSDAFLGYTGAVSSVDFDPAGSPLRALRPRRALPS